MLTKRTNMEHFVFCPFTAGLWKVWLRKLGPTVSFSNRTTIKISAHYLNLRRFSLNTSVSTVNLTNLRPATFRFLSFLLGLVGLLNLLGLSPSQSAIISNCYADEAPFILPKREEIHKLKSALVKTDRGDLWFELFPEIAPWHVANLKYLADLGFYREIPFKHYFEGYIIQTDNPRADRKFKYSIPPEFSDRVHDVGALGMARFPDGANPDRRSDATRFHIILGRSPNLDGSYTVFGQLINGFNALKKLRPGDRIRDVKVFVRDN